MASAKRRSKITSNSRDGTAEEEEDGEVEGGGDGAVLWRKQKKDKDIDF